jgi:hypothetical protein
MNDRFSGIVSKSWQLGHGPCRPSSDVYAERCWPAARALEFKEHDSVWGSRKHAKFFCQKIGSEATLNCACSAGRNIVPGTTVMHRARTLKSAQNPAPKRQSKNDSRRGTGVLILSREWTVCQRRAVRRAPFALFAFAVASVFAKSPAPEVIFISPCECEGFHGKNRWIAKTDLTPVPLDKSAIQSVTPSQIYAWEGTRAGCKFSGHGRSAAKVEADGDIHIALEDATGNNVGTVSAEIPVDPKWCEIRETVFGWTTQKFPLKIQEPHVITVTGKAFYDIGHAPADHSNRRSTPKGYAVWEVHPVMALHVDQ